MNFQILAITLLFTSTLCADRPVIGILTLPSDVSAFDPADYSYFPSSYVKWIEAAGALVIPIQWDSTYDEIMHDLKSVNGILFTGGDTDLYLNNTQPGFTFNKFTDTASFIVSQVIQSNKAGKYFPLFATCQGFQLINYILSYYHEVLSPVADDMGVQRKLILNGNDKGTLLSGLSDDILNYLINTSGPYYSHHWGVLQSTYDQNKFLSEFFNVLAYGTDGNGDQYIALIEGKEIPIFGVQFHPEKHQFEWVGKALHDLDHITYAQQMANTFINQAKLNQNTISLEELGQKVIYNYKTTNRLSVSGSSFSEIYLFERNRVERKLDRLRLGIKDFTLQL